MMEKANKVQDRSFSQVYLIILVLALMYSLPGCKEDMKDVYKKAMKAYEAEDYQKASKSFEKIVEKYPNHSLCLKARLELGKMYLYKLKQPEKALKHLQDLYANSQPGTYSMEALKLIGHIYDTSLNNCPKAIDAYRLLVQNYASEIDASAYQLSIADCYFKLLDYGNAMTEYQALVEKYPESVQLPRAKFQIANNYALQEDWESSIALQEELLHSGTLSEQLRAETELELAFGYEQTERFEEALALYEELLNIDFNVVIIDVALLERKIERVQEAIKESKKGPSKVDWKRK
ncbi:hypothetical protein CSA56_05530 [candidate division KSB3 bacterium]|uniref:Uncharacterized protein n=1 Tax=candidate division KSB3 bacterium TaxID=2044937 RepID=A0A2G6KHF3_9BACT|nr:MAG: hypothetical protein CSA56_05530 [candidate division KSB3 bacterium]